MRRVFRRIGIGLAIVVGLAVVVRVIGLVGDLLARPALKRMGEKAEEYFSDFTAKGFEKPALYQEMEEGNAWDFYSRAAEEAEQLSKEEKETISEFLKRAGNRLRTPEVRKRGRPSDKAREWISLQDSVAEILSAYTGALDELRRGTKQKNCLTPMEYEKGIEAEIPAYMPFRDVGRLLAAHGCLQQERGRSHRATQDYLDVACFAEDMAGGSPILIARMIGVVCLEMVMDQIAADLRHFCFDRDDLERIAETFSLLDRTWPSLTAAFAAEYAMPAITIKKLSPARFARLLAAESGGGLPRPFRGWGLRLRLWRSLFSTNKAFVQSSSFSERELKSLEAAEGEDWATVRSVLDSCQVRARGSRNPLISEGPNYTRMWKRHTEALTWMRLEGAAALLEMYRLEKGQYPQHLDKAKKAWLETFLSDPITHQPWQYQTFPEGDSAAIYSPGFDLRDDGWEKEEIALILLPPSK